MDNKLITSNNLGLDKSVLQNLQTYDDFLSFYIELEEKSNAFGWLKADLLQEFASRHGDKSLEALSRDIKRPRATLSNYIRTAKAFPKEKRIQNASFSLHFQASFLDAYDDKTKEFASDKRFEWLEKAVDNGWSTRKLQREIQESKDPTTMPLCIFCGGSGGEIGEYLLYKLNVRKDPQKLTLHDHCYEQVLQLICKF